MTLVFLLVNIYILLISIMILQRIKNKKHYKFNWKVHEVLGISLLIISNCI
ncbi:MAG: hypothetical protein K0Q49_1469 [Haloplasmataceae bacterium]|jgi:hypothetical protein|nr:hypothetical protein [Haloplasmataceae bacterium]